MDIPLSHGSTHLSQMTIQILATALTTAQYSRRGIVRIWSFLNNCSTTKPFPLQRSFPALTDRNTLPLRMM